MQFHFGNHVLDVGRRELCRGSEPIAVEPQVFDLLLYLLQNRDRVASTRRSNRFNMGRPDRVGFYPDQSTSRARETRLATAAETRN